MMKWTILLTLFFAGTEAHGKLLRRLQDTIQLDTVSVKIVGGTKSSSPYPYFGKVAGCGASLVAPDMMLTAAHCTIVANKDYAYIGSTSPTGGVVRKVVKAVTHPDYDASTLEYDFKMLQLERSALEHADGTTTGLSTIALNTDEANPAQGDALLVMGFGVSDLNVSAHQQLDNPLSELEVQALPQDCDNQKLNHSQTLNADVMLCADLPNADGEWRGACVGDDGGPLVDTVSDVLVGVVSFAGGCGARKLPAVYSRVSAVAGWIRGGICLESNYAPSSCSTRSGSSEASLQITVHSDAHPSENAIVLQDVETGWRLWQVDYGNPPQRGSQWQRTFSSLPAGSYYMGVKDRAKDGICCYYGDGFIEVTNTETGRTVFRSDGKFESAIEGYIRITDNGKPEWADKSGNQALLDEKVDVTAVDPLWPGEYADSPFAFTINIHYDDYPDETTWSLELLAEAGLTPIPTPTPATSPSAANELRSFHQVDVAPGLYHLHINDEGSDGNCCSWGAGYFTITDAASVLWAETGNQFKSGTDAYIWVNGEGMAQKADHIEGLGYILVVDQDDVDSSPTAGEYITLGSATVELLLPEN